MDLENMSTASSINQQLDQFNNRTGERDRTSDDSERRNDTLVQPSYETLLKENLKLKLQLHEYETEISSLKKFVELLKNNRSATKEVQQQITVEEKVREPALPPRSAERRRNAKNLCLPVMKDSRKQSENFRSLLSPAGITTSRSLSGLESFTESPLLRDDQSLTSSDRIRRSSSSYSNVLAASPATSVAYTTSRISPSRSNKHLLKDDDGASSSGERPSLLQRSSKVILPPSDSFTSPLRQVSGTTEPEDSENSTRKSYPKSPIPNLMAQQETNSNISPASKKSLNNFTEMLNTSFGEDDQHLELGDDQLPPDFESNLGRSLGKSGLSPSAREDELNYVDDEQHWESEGIEQGSHYGGDEELANFQENEHQTTQEIVSTSSDLAQNGARLLGSPVNLKKFGLSPTQPQSVESPNLLSCPPSEEQLRASTVSSSASTQLVSAQDRLSPKAFQTRGLPSLIKVSTNSTVHSPREKAMSIVNDSQSVVSDIPLFLQPGELGTIRIDIASTLHSDNDNFANDHYILFSVIDKTSNKEIFKFAKSFARVYELDVYLKCHMDTIMLPPLPERSTFDSITPSKVDYRREKLNDYFSCLYNLQNLLPDVTLKMAKFISTDTVMNPTVGDYAKEGILMMRKSKALGSTNSWRLRYAIVDGGNLTLLDKGQITEVIKLSQAGIELQANLPDDRYGTKNGFILSVHKKGGLSSGTRYYFCCESPRERESWVSTLTELVESSVVFSGSIYSKSENSSILDHSSTNNDTSADAAPSYLGPIANLQEPGNQPQSQKVEPGTTEDEKETKRSRMRSFFPFKRATASQVSSDTDYLTGGDSNTLSTQPNEYSISKSLQALDLGPEKLTETVFGSELRKCVALSSQLYQGAYVIPSVVYRCLEYLYRNHGIEEEGIFRISGSSLLIKSLQEQFDREHDIDLCNYNNSVSANDSNSFATGLVDVNTITGLLKLYLRKMPHVIFGDSMLTDFKSALDSNWGSGSKVALEYRRLVNSPKLTSESYALMYALFELLVKINQKSSINKMNLRNLCIVFSPTLNIPVSVLQPFIVDFGCIFKNEEPIQDSQRETVDIDAPAVILKEINNFFA